MAPFSLNTNDVIFLLVALILIFIIIREVLCWYWKINERVSLMEKMVTLQSETAKLQAETGNLLVNIHTESQKNNKLLQELALKSEKSFPITNSASVIPTVVEESL